MRQANVHEPLFSSGAIRISDRYGEWIREDRRCFSKRNPMLGEVRVRLGRIPFKDEAQVVCPVRRSICTCLTCAMSRAGAASVRLEPVVRDHFTRGMPRSLHIFRARSSSISLCLGTAERLFSLGLCHQEWRLPSRNSSQPCACRWRNRSLRFIGR